MADTILPYALTTLQRVKDRMWDTNTGATQPSAFNDLLTRMINSCTDFIEREMGGRRLKQTLYTNQVYSAYGAKQRFIALKQAPINVFISPLTTVSGSASITVENTSGWQANMPVLGDNIPAGAVIQSITNTTTAVLSLPASASASTGAIQVNGLLALQWRAGTPATNPAWTSFISDQFEIVDDGKAGLVRLYGVMPRLMNNMVRATYYAGYIINWIYAGDGVNHTLPADITDLCENLVVRRFKRRQLAGKASEAVGEATTSWKDEMDAEDKAVIEHYKMAPMIL